MRKLLTVFLLVLPLLSACERDTSYDAFANCLAENGAKFYGAFWCPHCQDQKKMFGDSADLLPYVECDPNGKEAQAGLCAEKKIESYPTWIFNDEQVEVGVLTFEELSEYSSCPLPGTESVMLSE